MAQLSKSGDRIKLAWAKLSSTTLASAGDTISSGTITAKKFIQILTNSFSITNPTRPNIRVNGDTGSNYADRLSENGGAENAGGSATKIRGASGIDTLVVPYLTITYSINISTEEKLFIEFICQQNTAGAGNAPQRVEVVGKWVNTTNQMTQLDVFNDDAGDFDSNSNQSVLGTD